MAAITITVDDQAELRRTQWTEMVKARAGGRCEECGTSDVPMDAHHVNGHGSSWAREHDCEPDNRLANGQCGDGRPARVRRGGGRCARGRTRPARGAAARPQRADRWARMTVGTKFITPVMDPDYESPQAREVRLAQERIAHYETRGSDPTYLDSDRARFNALANEAKRELSVAEAEEWLAEYPVDPDYDEDEQYPEEETEDE